MRVYICIILPKLDYVYVYIILILKINNKQHNHYKVVNIK